MALLKQLVQTLWSHCELAQSVAKAQRAGSSQRSQTAPPQSTSVSPPFCAPSPQLTQTPLLPAASLQMKEAQSALTSQVCPRSHVLPSSSRQTGPPQSVDVSPFPSAPSEQTSSGVSSRQTRAAAAAPGSGGSKVSDGPTPAPPVAVHAAAPAGGSSFSKAPCALAS